MQRILTPGGAAPADRSQGRARTTPAASANGLSSAGASEGGELLAEQVARTWPNWAESVAFVPATRAAMRRRGFDHGRAIAVTVAEDLGVPLVDPLRRAAAADQRLLGRADRARNAAGSFAATEPLTGCVLLCDDVFTTGATLDAAANVLLDAGASEVRCATVARAW